MSTLSLEDFIPVYPDVEVPELQTLITAKKEFNELGALTREPPPGRGQLYLHQKFFLRYLTAYDRILNIQETGTGKSCAFVALAEYYKKHPGVYRHVYVLEKGDTTLNDFKYQIVCKCTNGEYETAMVREAVHERARKGNATRETNKWYTMDTYHKFVSKIADFKTGQINMTDQEIIDAFSGCIFLIDEGHNLRGEGEKKGPSDQLTYQVIWKVLHLCNRIKVVVSTATPMINDVGEIARVANLALPSDWQLPPDGVWDYKKVTLEQLEPFFRGRVTFVRGLDTGAVPEYQGEIIKSNYDIEIPDPKWVAPPLDLKAPQPQPPMVRKQIKSQVRIYGTTMGDIQNYTYHKLIGEGKTSSVYSLEIQASCFVFPVFNDDGVVVDGEVGGVISRPNIETPPLAGGAGTWILTSGPDKYSLVPAFRDWLVSIDDLGRSGLSRCSSKYAEILQIEYSEPGCGFCYIDSVEGGGAIMLGLCSELYEFERFNESESVFVAAPGAQKSYCMGTSGTQVIRPDFVKKRRYGLLTSNTSPSKISHMLQLMSSEENVYGEYLKLVISSRIGRDGINLSNVVRGHLITPSWHPSGMHQALSRFLRATSHDYLISLLRQKAIERGEDPSTVVVPVKIYKHASLPYPIPGFEEGIYSTDLQMYLLAETKDLYIRRLMRMLKQIAIDCQINRSRNIRLTDVDYSPVCDYELCNYTCFPAGLAPEAEIDFSTYDILYADEAIDSVVLQLTMLLRERGTVTFTELYQKWIQTGIFRARFVYSAIDRLLSEKHQLLDRFGFTCFVQTDGFNIYTQRQFPTPLVSSTQQDLAIYAEQVIGILSKPFDKIVARMRAPVRQVIINQMHQIPDPMGAGAVMFNVLLNKLSLESRVELLERSISELLLTPGESKVPEANYEFNTAIYNKFKSYVFSTPEPWEDINASAASMAAVRIQTRKNGEKSVSKPKFTPKGPPPAGSLRGDGQPVPTIWLHNLYSADYDLTSYTVTVRYNRGGDRIRIYNQFDGQGWRDANPYEFPVYISIVQNNLKQRMQYFEELPIYGTVLADGKFRIRNKSTENKKEAARDSRMVHRGKKCGSIDKGELLDIMLRETTDGYPPGLTNRIMPPTDPTKPPYSGPYDRSSMIQYLTEHEYSTDPYDYQHLSDVDLEYLCRWYYSKAAKKVICALLMERFKKTGRLYQV